MGQMRADYNAPKDTRFSRRRTGLGGSGDSHYAIESNFYTTIENIRDEERNGWAVPRILDLAVEQEIGIGPSLDPETGDPDVDRYIKEKHEDWSTDKTKCDIQRRFTFLDQTCHVRRGVWRDGDICSNLLDDGRIELLEADRLRSPSFARNNKKRGVFVHGVEINDYRMPIRYWFTKDPGMTRNIKLADMQSYQAFDDDGNPTILHIADPNRVSQARGVSPFARVFDKIGMGGDIEFANLVKQQTTSFFAMAIKKNGAAGFPGAGQETESSQTNNGTAFDRIIQQLGAGMIVPLKEGEELQSFSPSVPGDSFFPHMRLIMQEICVTCGLSLVQVLLDASETNFSGYRGATDSSRKQCKHNRKRVTESQWLTPVHLWRMRRLVKTDTKLRIAYKRLGDRIFTHKWKWPGWDYIQPQQDANADKLKRDNILTSPRRMYGERGLEIEHIITETVADNSSFIVAAINESRRVAQLTGVLVDWKDFLFLNAKHDPNAFIARQAKANQPGANPNA